MKNNSIRTTINLPKELHEQLRITAIRERKTMNDVAVENLRKSFEPSRALSKDQTTAILHKLRSIAKDMPARLQAVEAVRWEREIHDR